MTFVQGMVGEAFHFNGDDGFVQTPTTGLPSANSDRTVELWAKIDAFAVEEEAFFTGFGDFGSNTQAYLLTTERSSRTVAWSQCGTGIGGPPLVVGVWYHIAVTNVDRLATLYVNGSVVGSGTFDINTPSSTPLCIGRIAGGFGDDRRLNGTVDEVSAYNRALSPAEISAIYAAGSAGKCSDSVTFASLCTLSHQLVSNRGLANGMCTTLQAAQRSNARGLPNVKANLLRTYAGLLDTAQRIGAVTAEQAVILKRLSATL